MKLWVRSQDKELLTKVEGAYYDYQQEKHHITVFTNNDYHWVGIYKTKERALEVLDEINEILQLKLCSTLGTFEKAFDGYTEEQLRLVLKQMAVYEMPKE